MHQPTPTVTAIIPTFNRLERLPVAIDSVLAQTYPALELVIVDDGSTDGTSAWLNEHHPEITLITQANHGVSHARNRAIERASGEWIALLDSDDRWYEQKIARQIDALSQSPGFRLCHSDEHWIRHGRRVNPKVKHRKHGGDIFMHCLPLCAISPSATVIHRSLLDEVGLFDESLPACEDYDLWLRICAREPVLFVDEALLEKTGGHDDQLSQRYQAMDRFRLYALAKLLRDADLDADKRRAAQEMFNTKFTIFSNGALKRGQDDVVQALCKQYAELIAAQAD